ncbi:disulfide bond formation protein B [Psychromonas sp. CNPT3]|uniref:disulfide bond formation protein DsbB n=1 Tax=Psychromonas sp. CNPT3 TaxID=314282 RepID=UPI00006E423F|nr:disulfide bond formation protein DsbB [Psychromonas sp. CNPT3]AGH81066.1 disulfide bond formation protein B [Psychromonas sp. CNPT3]
MFLILKNLSKQRWPWLLLASSALTLELCALFFQHVMHLEPCVMCVYERLAMIGLIVTGLIGAIAPQFLLLRLIAFSSWLISAYWGLQLALEHTKYQLDPSPFAVCAFLPDFPNWAPLHLWFPWLFNPTGDCANIVWQFLGYTMPQWLIVSFIIYLVLFIVIAGSALYPKKWLN